MKYLYSLLVVGFLLFVACPPAAETAGPEETPAAETPAVTVEEVPTQETVSPETTATESIPPETTAVETTATEAPPAPPSAELTPAPKMGYRVQIGAFSSEERANALKIRASTELNEKVYVDFIEGLYKVQVGDFLTREDAEAFKEKVISMGYDKGSFIVETEISP